MASVQRVTLPSLATLKNCSCFSISSSYTKSSHVLSPKSRQDSVSSLADVIYSQLQTCFPERPVSISMQKGFDLHALSTQVSISCSSSFRGASITQVHSQTSLGPSEEQDAHHKHLLHQQQMFEHVPARRFPRQGLCACQWLLWRSTEALLGGVHHTR